MKKNIICILLIVTLGLSTLTGCAGIESEVNNLEGSIKGCTYDCMFYSNDGDLFMTATGENINITSNIVKEKTYN